MTATYEKRAYRNVLPGRTRDTPKRTIIDLNKYGFNAERTRPMTPQSAEAVLRTMIREHLDEIEYTKNDGLKQGLAHRVKALNCAIVGISKLTPTETTDAAATVEAAQ